MARESAVRIDHRFDEATMRLSVTITETFANGMKRSTDLTFLLSPDGFELQSP